jgi:hypothetical protein
MERVSSSGARGPFDPTYFGKLKEVVAYITSRGAYTVLDPHNFMRFNGSVINSPSEFQAWWARLASEFASNNRVIFDLMNGPRDIDNNLVAQLSQAAVPKKGSAIYSHIYRHMVYQFDQANTVVNPSFSQDKKIPAKNTIQRL